MSLKLLVMGLFCTTLKKGRLGVAVRMGTKGFSVLQRKEYLEVMVIILKRY